MRTCVRAFVRAFDDIIIIIRFRMLDINTNHIPPILHVQFFRSCTCLCVCACVSASSKHVGACFRCVINCVAI